MVDEQLPFDSYPGGGRQLIGMRKGANTRNVDAPEFMRLTGLRKCAYCGLDFSARFEDWLTIALDHVVPQSVCLTAGIQTDWVWDYSNHVIACAACNGFCNRFTHPLTVCPASIAEFYALRDEIFRKRRPLILKARAREQKHFERKPWESGQADASDDLDSTLNAVEHFQDKMASSEVVVVSPVEQK
jgi:hypothetical protein